MAQTKATTYDDGYGALGAMLMGLLDRMLGVKRKPIADVTDPVELAAIIREQDDLRRRLFGVEGRLERLEERMTNGGTAEEDEG